MGQLIEAGLLDEAFLTVSPVIAGRNNDKRLGMVQGVELLPGHGAWSKLSSVTRHGDYLFLRYRAAAGPTVDPHIIRNHSPAPTPPRPSPSTPTAPKRCTA